MIARRLYIFNIYLLIIYDCSVFWYTVVCIVHLSFMPWSQKGKSSVLHHHHQTRGFNGVFFSIQRITVVLGKKNKENKKRIKKKERRINERSVVFVS